MLRKIEQFQREAKKLGRDGNSIEELKMWVEAAGRKKGGMLEKTREVLKLIDRDKGIDSDKREEYLIELEKDPSFVGILGDSGNLRDFAESVNELLTTLGYEVVYDELLWDLGGVGYFIFRK